MAASTSARSTYQVYLMESDGGSSYTKLVDIKSFPDLGGSPETLETTTLSDKMQTNILGIQSLDTLEFDCNYIKADYAKLKALEGQKDHKFAIWMGGTAEGQPTGEDGKFEFRGELSVWVTGGGVNEVVGMTVAIAASTIITESAT